MTTFIADLLTLTRGAQVEHPLFLIGLLLLIGYLAGKLAGYARLPEISGFIVAGLAVSLLSAGKVSRELNAMLHVVTEVAISFLALSIGAEFSMRKLRRIGRGVAVITAVHLAGTFLIVLLGCLLLNWAVPSIEVGYPYAILLAVIACATSPAIIAAEVHHLRAHGRFVDYLFGVVALGDAVAVVLFGLAFTLVTNILGDTGSYSHLWQSLFEIVLAIAAGAAFAIPISLLARLIRNTSELTIIAVGFIFVITGACLALQLSPLLLNMALGAVLVNLPGGNQRIFRAVEPLTPPVYALFFIIAGLEIDPSVFRQPMALVVGGGYILLRAFAKCASAAAGCRLCHLGRSIERYLGLCMLSKGGVALGFVLLIQTSPALDPVRGKHLSDLVNIVLVSIFVNELASPLLLRYAVARGNEMEAS